MSAAPEQDNPPLTASAPDDEPFTLQVRDGMIRLDWRSGIVVDCAHAIQVIEQVGVINKRWTLPMLGRLNEMKFVSRRAMQLFAQELDVMALAVVGASPVDRTISGFFVHVHQPAYPVRHFSTTGSALSWLRGSLGEPSL